ncbi:MAG: type II secretion system F family protein [Magnetococcus sp. MYC-9]
MPRFRYAARNRQQIVTGSVQAADCLAAATQLLARRLEPLTIEPQGEEGGEGPLVRLRLWSPAEEEALILFARQMSALVHAGVPLVRALQGVGEHLHHPAMKKSLREVVAELQSGRDLASALASHPQVFGRLFPRLVRMGEQTGRLEDSFAQMHRYLEMDREIRRRIRTALRYPALVLLTACIALFVVNYFVVPSFAGLFARFGAELPLLTRLLVATSRFTQAYWPVFLLALAGMAYGWTLLLQTRRAALWWDRYKLRLPLVGSIIHRALLARLARTFAMGAHSGLTVSQTLSMVAESLDNRFMAQKLERMNDGVERGETLTQAAYHSGLFPAMVLQMVSVGEQTGRVGEMLVEVAQFYDREVEYEIQTMSALVEPLLIFVVALFVLVLALGIFLPMWNLGAVALGKR